MGRAPLLVELAEQKATTSENARLRAMAVARVLADAQSRGNHLTTRLADSQQRITQLEKEKHHAIKRLTTGRPCLSADAVRVLNQPSYTAPTGLEPVPPPPGSAAAADGAFATDTDVGLWIASAKAQYDICRDRLDALIDFDAAHPTQATTGHDH